MTFEERLVVVVVASAAAFLGLVFATVAPVLPLIVEHFQSSDDGNLVAQWVLTMPSVGIAIGGPAAGWVVGKFGARLVLLVCLILFALIGLSGFVIESTIVLLASKLAVGIMAAGQATASSIVLGETFVGIRRGSVIGFQIALASVAGVAAFLSAGILGEWGGWRAPSALYAVALPVALLAAFVVPRSVARRSQSRSEPGAFRAIVLVLALTAVTMMISFISAGQVPLLLSEHGISRPSLVSAVLGGTTIATTVGALLYNRIRIRVGAVRTNAIGGALQALGLLFLAASTGLGSIALGAIILALGSGILTPGFSHAIMERSSEAARARAIGMLLTAQFAGPFLCTALILPVIESFGRVTTLIWLGTLLFAAWSVVSLRAQGPLRSNIGSTQP